MSVTEIKTDRLLLRGILPGDAEDMFGNWTGDPIATRYLTWSAHKCQEDTNNYVKFCLEQEDDKSWMIEKDGNVIGNISVVHENEHLKSAELGYVIGRKFWGQGITTEAVRAVVSHLFSLGYHRVEAKHHVENKASGRVMQKAGMTYEGIRRSGNIDNRGEFCDVACYAIIEGDPR